jgi:hypothetical protein
MHGVISAINRSVTKRYLASRVLATLDSKPLMNPPDSSVEYPLANSTASLIATPLGTSEF